MRIKKAVITAAGEKQRLLPLQTLIDRDGEEKSVLGILIEQALAANIEEVCVVVWPGDEARCAQAVSRHLGHVRFVPQPRPLGYGHAVYCAREFVGGDPFLHLVGDHLWASGSEASCARGLVELAESEKCAVSAVQVTRENLLPRYGAVSGRRIPGRQGLYRIDTVVEKPTPTEAEQRLTTPGLRAGYYLCFFGMHVLTPVVMELLEEQLAAAPDARISLSPALSELAQREEYLALEEQARRYDIGARYGLLTAQLALAFDGRDRTEVLAQLVELLAAREMAEAGGGRAVSELIAVIQSSDPAVRDRSLDGFCRAATLERLLAECDALDRFRRSSDNLYERVRALFFLYAIHRFHIPARLGAGAGAPIPYSGYASLLKRRFHEALDVFLAAQAAAGPGAAVSSALAAGYRALGFQTLADQVRRSVRSVKGNQWMFRTGHPADYPLRIRPEMLARQGSDPLFPILRETTPVRMDLTHSGWSDIFFLGMDFPEGARVLNISIDLSVRGAGADTPRPPVEAYFRVIDRPVLRLASVDLKASVEIATVAEVFDFARDYLGLLKAAVIASGMVPSGMEGSTRPLAELLAALTGVPGHGIEIVSKVNDIPKGSRLAVSTSLLSCLIAACMRATGQVHSLAGGLDEQDRRLVAARAILGEWLGGSGGGWQDSGGVWPGIKLIHGVCAVEGDPEFGISRGRLLPSHKVFGAEEVSPAAREGLQQSLVLVHGGMAQDVGPILEMVTEKYLLRSEAEWQGRREAIDILDEILERLKQDDIRGIGSKTHRNFDGPMQTIIPWAGNLYTDSLIRQARAAMGEDFWGFWMLGGMSGGGMGFLFSPRRKTEAQDRLAAVMRETKRRLEHAVPFAMDPVVYNFAINERGTEARVLSGEAALLPAEYYTLAVPALLRADSHLLSPGRRAELDRFSAACRATPEFSGMVQQLFDHMLPRRQADRTGHQSSLERLLAEHGFDAVHHERIQADLRAGRIGLAQNRLAANSKIEDPGRDAIFDATGKLPRRYLETGRAALAEGAVAVVTLAGGLGSRWTKGAGVVKALNPFCLLGGRRRSFLEVHLAKSLRVGREAGALLPHVITTSYLTHQAIESYLRAEQNYGYPGPLLLSAGCAIGLRMVPMERNLRFVWEETPQQVLDEQAQKVRESLHATLIAWAKQMGEGSNYTDNLPLQCLHPVGHWYEVPNMLRNGTLAALLAERPHLKHLMLHNVDTAGANVDAALLGYHIEQGAAMTAEVIERHIEDRGGGLAAVDGRLRLVEGLALPSEEIESRLSYYNSATYWIDTAQLLDLFGLSRDDLGDSAKVAVAIRNLAARMPTYITLKDVKKRWGKGQEDVFPAAQFEKLWGDMTALPEWKCRFALVPRMRGQQLKEPAQLDGWLRDGSAAYVEGLCGWGAGG